MTLSILFVLTWKTFTVFKSLPYCATFAINNDAWKYNMELVKIDLEFFKQSDMGDYLINLGEFTAYVTVPQESNEIVTACAALEDNLKKHHKATKINIKKAEIVSSAFVILA